MVLNFLLALLPILWLFVAFLALKMPGYLGCLIALVIAVVESIVLGAVTGGTAGTVMLHGLNVSEALSASLEGVLGAVFPIAIIIIAAMFTYNLCVETRAMDLIKRMLTSVTNDKRKLVLILAWGFGGFMEAVAGFGTAVAIPAAMMVAVGFDPMFSAVACLLTNACNPTFGSIGIPTTTAGGLVADIIAGGDASAASAMIAGPAINMLAIPAFLSPFLVVLLTGKALGKKNAFKGMLPFALAASLSYVVPAVLIGNFLGAEFVDLVGNTLSLVVMILVARLSPPCDNPDYVMELSAREDEALRSVKFGTGVAWVPYILMLVLLIGTSKLIPALNGPFNAVKTVFRVYTGPNPGSVSFSWFGNAGFLILISGILGGLCQHASPALMGQMLVKTCRNMWKAIATIVFIVAVAKVMGYSGMTTSIAYLLAELTGGFYAALAPVVGIIGTFVTGSTTSSGVLFAKMQAEVAEMIRAGDTPLKVSLIAANMAGGAIGKLISPQSIAVACAAIGLEGVDGKIMRRTVGYCVGFGVIVCIVSVIL